MTRVGIIGLGFGVAVHLPAFRAVPGVQIVALGGRSPQKARELAANNGIELGGTADQVLHADLDALVIALPPTVGAGVVERALDKGIAVLAEKPLANNAAHALALARKACGRTATVDFEFAEFETFQGLKERVQAAAVQALHVRWRTQSYSHAKKRWSWKLDRAQDGGVMNLLGSHVLYMAEWLVGPLVELEARFFNERTKALAPADAEPAEDRALLRGTFRNGASIEIEIDNASGGGGLEWEVVLADRRLVVSEGGTSGTFALFDSTRQASPIVRDSVQPGIDWRVEPVRRLAARFVSAVGRNASCPPDFAAGARVQRLLEAAAESAANGRTIRLEMPLGTY
jgi:predicted dehydrogenase